MTGLPISTYFSGTKFKWMVENVPEVKQAVDSKTCCFGTVDSWIIYNLTGRAEGGIHITDGERLSTAHHVHEIVLWCCVVSVS